MAQVTIIDKIGEHETVDVDQDAVAATLRKWFSVEVGSIDFAAHIDELQQRLNGGKDVRDQAQFLGIKIL